MTTIVYKSGVIAADKLAMHQDDNGKCTIAKYEVKLYTPNNMLFNKDRVVAYGIAGESSTILAHYLAQINAQKTPIDLISEFSTLANAAEASVIDSTSWLIVTRVGVNNTKCSMFTFNKPPNTPGSFIPAGMYSATVKDDRPLAIGSGSEYISTLDAMYQDATAYDLVQMASLFDADTSFDVDYVDTNHVTIALTANPITDISNATSHEAALSYLNGFKKRDAPLRRNIDQVQPEHNNKIREALTPRVWFYS